MRSLGGFVLLAGIGVGLFVYFPAPVDHSTPLEQASARKQAGRGVEPAPADTSIVPAPAASRVASFSPAANLKSAVPRSQLGSAPAAPSKALVATPAAIETIASWQTTSAPARSGSLEPTDPDKRYKLVVDIQQQLKRVGCYWGRANGSWNASTRQAMREFATHTNSALPVEKPDYMLLTLLSSHNGRSCGATQPGVAAPSRGPQPWQATVTNRPQPPAARLFTPVPTSLVSTEPLPGRMSIGGPREPETSSQAPLIPGGSASRQGFSTAAVDHGAATSGAGAPASAAKPRFSKRTGGHRASPGTPRYNLMLSLGGVY